MKQNSGIVAILTIVLAAFGISNLQKGAPSNGAGSESTKKSESKPKPTSKAPTLSPACEEIRDRLQPFFDESGREGGKKTGGAESRLLLRRRQGTKRQIPAGISNERAVCYRYSSQSHNHPSASGF
jgi:hypothetical protein